MEMLVREMTGVLHTGISRLAWLRAPVIAAINGVAAGAGLSFAACCDLAIASDTATFTSAYTRIGLTPDGSSTFFLTRLLGRRRVMELYMTNRVLSAQEALDWGLVNRVVPAADLMTEVTKLATQLARGHQSCEFTLRVCPATEIVTQAVIQHTVIRTHAVKNISVLNPHPPT